MIKMKKKWLRGGTALALAAVMSMSLAMPVLAGQEGEYSYDGDSVSHAGSTDTTLNETFEGKSSVVQVNVNSTYTITFPKTITLDAANLAAGASNAFTYKVKYNLAPTQKLQVKASGVNLYNKNGSGDVLKQLNTTLKNKDNTDSSTGIVTIAEGNGSTSVDQYQNDNLTMNGYFTNVNDIRAGKWRGIVQFSARITEETDGNTLKTPQQSVAAWSD